MRLLHPVLTETLLSSTFLIFALISHTSGLYTDAGVGPTLDVSPHFDAIFHYKSEQAWQVLKEFLGQDLSQDLYLEIDFTKEAFTSFKDFAKRIADMDSSTSLNYTRKFLIAFRFDIFTRKQDGILDVKEDVLRPLLESSLGILIDRHSFLRNTSISCPSVDQERLITSFLTPMARLLSRIVARTGFPFLLIGMGYKNVADCGIYSTEKVPPAQFFVLTIDLEPEVGFAESYHIFSNFLKLRLARSENYFDVQLYPKSQVILRLNLKANANHGGMYKEEFGSYQKLLWSFASRWWLETRKMIILNFYNEFEPNDDGMMLPFQEEQTYFWNIPQNRVVPFMFGLIPPYEPLHNACLRARLHQIGGKFDNLLLDLDAWMTIVANKGDENKKCRFDDNLMLPPLNILLLVKLKYCFNKPCTTVEQVLADLENKYESDGLRVTSLLFEFNATRDPSPFLQGADLEAIPRHVAVGCLSNFGELRFDEPADGNIEINKTNCPILEPRKKVSMWEFHVDLKAAQNANFTFEFYIKSVQLGLYNLSKKLKKLKKVEPGAEVILRFVTSTPPEWKVGLNVLCSGSILGSNLLFEAIGNWAHIHNVSVVLKPAFDVGHELGWWSTIDREYFVARNYPDYSNFGVDPCISWEDGFGSKINFFRKAAPTTGIALNLGDMTHERKQHFLNADELKTLLALSFHTFPKVELIPNENNLTGFISDLERMTELILDASFPPYLNLNGIQNSSVFLTITLEFLTEGGGAIRQLLNVWREFQNSSSSVMKLEAVHIDGVGTTCSENNWPFESRLGNDCENQNEVARHFDLVDELREFTKVGIVYYCGKCAESPTQKKVLEKANYIVLNDAVVLPPNPKPLKSIVQSFCERIVIMQRRVLAKFPHLESIMIRQVLHTDLTQDVESNVTRSRYLSYLSNLHNFAKEFNIGLLFLGFGEDEIYTKTILRRKFKLQANFWWRIQNYSDLSDTSIYSEMQADYFNETTWYPRFEEFSEESDPSRNETTAQFPWLIILASVLGVFLFLTLTLSIFRLRRKVKFLSNKQLREFYDGVGADESRENNSSLVDVADERNYICQGFDKKKFEIPKNEFESGEWAIVGMGNFGTVYGAVVREINVAVKVPHDNCSKVSFVSMLSEVKILAYIGAHENLVEFVGCYTKEIEQGVIFIATKLCERGTLQNYLRNEIGKSAGGKVVNTIKMDELLRFSAEIAGGMEYIAGRHVVHGDLSTRNVLLDANLTCKIGDFGLSRKLYEYAKYVKKSQEPLPWRWLAYESLVRFEFTTKSDVWSYGITLWEIFSLGQIPYPGLTWSVEFTEELRKGLRMASPQFATRKIYETMVCCWELDAEARPDFKELANVLNEINISNPCQQHYVNL